MTHFHRHLHFEFHFAPCPKCNLEKIDQLQRPSRMVDTIIGIWFNENGQESIFDWQLCEDLANRWNLKWFWDNFDSFMVNFSTGDWNLNEKSFKIYGIGQFWWKQTFKFLETASNLFTFFSKLSFKGSSLQNFTPTFHQITYFYLKFDSEKKFYVYKMSSNVEFFSSQAIFAN